MRSLGMIPVLPGFGGHIPKALVNRLYPDSKYYKLNPWNGFYGKFGGTFLLDPQDPLFKVSIIEFSIFDCTNINVHCELERSTSLMSGSKLKLYYKFNIKAYGSLKIFEKSRLKNQFFSFYIHHK